MPNGHDFRCENCQHEWRRYHHSKEFGPPCDRTRTYRCTFCDFNLTIPAYSDGSAWRSFIRNRRHEINTIGSFEKLAAQLTLLFGDTLYKTIELDIASVECVGCKRIMTTDTPKDMIQCPLCESADVRVESEFADCISYIDREDALRWWELVGH
jgi:hypothetical protein